MDELERRFKLLYGAAPSVFYRQGLVSEHFDLKSFDAHCLKRTKGQFAHLPKDQLGSALAEWRYAKGGSVMADYLLYLISPQTEPKPEIKTQV